MNTKLSLRSYRAFLLLAAFVAAGGCAANGQTIFSARDFLFTLQFKPGRDIVPDPAGTPMVLHSSGIYVAGAFQTAGIDFQAFFRRYDSSGKEVWTYPVAADGGAFPSALAADSSGIYLAGSVGMGRSELFLRKYDEAGAELWSRQIRISSGGYHLVAGMVADSSNLYLAAWDGRSEGLLRKYSQAGEEIWSRTLQVRSLLGLSVSDGIYLAGATGEGGFVNKYTAAGDQLWSHQLDASPTESVLPAALAADDTGVYVGGAVYRKVRAGDLTFIPESGEAILRRLDANGAEMWAKRFANSIYNGVVSMARDSTGIYAAGWTQRALPGQCKAGINDIFVRRYNTAGAELWTRQFGTAYFDFAGTVALDSTGVYVSGGIRGGAAHGSLFVVKLAKTPAESSDPRPQISQECVVNAASYVGGGVTPGEIVTILGRAMGPPEPVPQQLAEDGRVATTLAGARVLFNGVDAPLLSVSDKQISAAVPFGVSDSPAVNIEIEYQGVRSDPLVLPVLAARPGIFTVDGSGVGQGVILNEAGSPNSPENPAAKGSVIRVSVTGAGLTDPPVANGAILTDTTPKPRLPVTVLFDDPVEEGTISPAEVLSTGAKSQSVAGIFQVNVRVPEWAPSGDAVPIYLQVGSEYAESGVTVALR